MRNWLKNTLFFIFCLINIIDLSAFDFEVFENKIYNSNIKTVQFYPKGYNLAAPITLLGSSEKLVLGFDDFSNELKDYFYTVIQCDYEWKATTLYFNEYIEGYNEGSLRDYDFSAGTKQKFIHYKLEFPNLDMTIKKSGNYALVAYEGRPENVLFVQRFMVYENGVQIDASVNTPRMVGADNFQQIQFSINHKGFPIENAYQEIKTTVMQNDRIDNAKIGVQPLFIRENELLFNQNNDLVFLAGKEFREFDTRTIRFKGEGVTTLELTDTSNVFYLIPYPIRSTLSYQQDRDLNGKYYIDIQERWRDDYEADYATVKFLLPMELPLGNGDIYIYGAFNNWQLGVENRMVYREDFGGYIGEIYLKQGFYNYEYIFVDDKKEIIDHSMTEGNYYNTENDYTILVYYRPFTERYDRLIGVKFLNSITDRF